MLEASACCRGLYEFASNGLCKYRNLAVNQWSWTLQVLEFEGLSVMLRGVWNLKVQYWKLAMTVTGVENASTGI